ncbi:hypothetical protein [Bdellovibrio sp. HCB-162]|uniref:hypothetical protein n=1 Tax=Bdellovibrio sp. HCB-162 TaxID=3394234 RepID=UPI0039BD0FF2
MGFQLHKIILIYFSFTLLGCGIEASFISSKSSVAVEKLDNSGVVTDTNQNSFLMEGICKDISEVVVSTDSFSVNTPCIDNKWSINLDLSALSGQVINVKLVGVSKTGTKDPSTSVKLTKKLPCGFDNQTIQDGQSIVAYTSNTVAPGDSCSSIAETRLCTNGVLSGSAAFSSCTAGAENAAVVTVEEFEERVSETAGAKSFTFRMSEAKTYPVVVKYFVSGDYVYMLDADLNPAGTVTLNPGETSKTISYQVLNNGVAQPERLLQINLIGTDKPMVSLGEHYQGRLFIMDNDGGSSPSIDKAFVVGSQITCMITTDGTLYCGGAQFLGTPVEVDAGVKYVKIEDSQQGNGDNQSFCGLTTTNKIKCNDGTSTAMTVVDAATNYIDFDSEYSLCGITDGNEMKCETGLNSGTLQVVDSGTLYKKLAKSYDRVCGLTMANTIRCSSANYWSLPNTFEDWDVGNLYSDVVTSGQSEVYALSTTGEWKAVCGYSGCTPTVLHAGTTYTKLFRQCAVSSTGQASCENSSLTLNYNFKHIYATGSGGNYQRACGVTTTGEMLCWNTSDWNYGGWKGIDAIAAGTPTTLQGLDNVANVFSNISSSTCAVLTNGKVQCFNGNVEGIYRSTPVDVKAYGSYSVKEIFNSWHFLSSDGYVIYNNFGTLTQVDTVKYTRFNNAGGWMYKFCGFTEDQKIRCQKNDGSFEELYSGATIKDYAGSPDQGCYLNSSGQLLCWDNYYNSLPTPTVVDNTDTYSQISGHYQRGCGIVATTGAMKCWDNSWNYTADPVVFTVQDPGVQFVKVLAPQGGYWDNKVCGITTTGVLKCGTRNGAYADADPGTTYSKIITSSCGITTAGKYRCADGFAAGGVYLNWKRPIVVNKWFTN